MQCLVQLLPEDIVGDEFFWTKLATLAAAGDYEIASTPFRSQDVSQPARRPAGFAVASRQSSRFGNSSSGSTSASGYISRATGEVRTKGTNSLCAVRGGGARRNIR